MTADEARQIYYDARNDTTCELRGEERDNLAMQAVLDAVAKEQAADTARLDWIEQSGGMEMHIGPTSHWFRLSWDTRDGLRAQIDRAIEHETEQFSRGVSA